MRMITTASAFVIIGAACATSADSARAGAPTRADALRIAESYINHRWHSSEKNLLHGTDRRGIEVHTPDRQSGKGYPARACWQVDADNLGVAYKWGGIDTPESFDTGIRVGKAAGDVYTSAKRRLDGDGVSDQAVGIDCSGFICRCWKLSKRYSTYSLGEVCRVLQSPEALRPADIMNHSKGHVLLFVRFLGDQKK